MEVLIMSCGTGGGHNTAGEAVAEELTRRGHAVTSIDPYTLAGENTSAAVDNAYIRLAQRSPRSFGALYALGSAYRHLPIHSPVYWANGKLAGRMKDFLSCHHFDAVVMSHMFPAQILTHLKNQGFPVPKTILIATDYTCIPFMEEAVCDFYVIPSQELAEEFQARGVPKDKLLPYGIPVRRAFLEPLDAPPPIPGRYLLLSGGSIGAGKISETVGVLKDYLRSHRDRSLVVICGNNRDLLRDLTDTCANDPQIHILGNVSNMAAYMRSCDVFITKPGGLSSTEAAACGAPLIHTSPIPGCETRNADFFEKRGMSLYVRDPKRELLPALAKLENTAEKMRLAQRHCVDGQSALRLCKFLEKQHRKEIA